MRKLTETSEHERAMHALRERCREVYQALGRNAMLRQGDPVETIFAFAKELISEREYVIGFNDGWDEGRAGLLTREKSHDLPRSIGEGADAAVSIARSLLNKDRQP